MISSTKALKSTAQHSYNYSRFKADYYQFEKFEGLSSGEIFIDFELRTTNGEKKKISDFLDKPLVLEMGSITCPMYAGNSKAMNEFSKKYTDFNFIVLYVREAHPGNRVKSHSSDESKIDAAIKTYHHYAESRNVLVDTLNGDAHKVYGSLPNSVFIIGTDRKILFCKPWNNVDYIEPVLKAIRIGQNANYLEFRPARPGLWQSIVTLFIGGWLSFFDFLIQLPKLFFNHLKAGNLF